MEKDADFLQIFYNLGVVIEDGHFNYASGLHGTTYINKDAIFLDPVQLNLLSREIAAHFRDERVHTVLGPVVEGAKLAGFVALNATLYNNNPPIPVGLVYAAHTDKIAGGKFAIRRALHKYIAWRRVLIVDDVITTGSSIVRVIKAVRSLNATVVGVGTFFNRGGVTSATLGVPKLYSIVDLPLDAWPKEECALCREGIPLTSKF